MLRILLGIILVLAFFDASAFEAISDPSISSAEQTSEMPNDPQPGNQANNEEDNSEKEKDSSDFYLIGYFNSYSTYKTPFHIYEFTNYKAPFLAGSRRPPKA